MDRLNSNNSLSRIDVNQTSMMPFGQNSKINGSVTGAESAISRTDSSGPKNDLNQELANEASKLGEKQKIDQQLQEKKVLEARRESEEKREEAEAKLSERVLEDLESDFANIHNVGLKFTKHDATGKTMVRVTDMVTESLIREIPPEKALDLAAKMDEIVGILFDKTV